MRLRGHGLWLLNVTCKDSNALDYLGPLVTLSGLVFQEAS